MATYHCSIKHGSKGNGASASAKADYVSREGKYADKPDLEYSESGNMPLWANDPRDFWKASDENERANGRVYTEIEVALPREISAEERKALVRGFVEEHLGGHPYTVGIHNPRAALDGGEQPHAHIIFTERKLDGIERDKEQFFKRANTKEPEKGGCAKDRSWNDQGKVQEIRESWEQHYNKTSEWDSDMVSCKSLKAQGIDRDPEPHLGPKSTRSPEAMRIIEHRAALKKQREIDREIQALEKEIAAEQNVQVTPQDIVAPPKPAKSAPTQRPEVKTEKKQEITNVPDTARRDDPDQLQGEVATTISSIPVQKTEPEKTKVLVPKAQSEALPLETKTNPPIQQPAFDFPALTGAELTAFTAFVQNMKNVLVENLVKLCQIASDMKKYTIQNEQGVLSAEKFNSLTDHQELQIKRLAPPGATINLPYEKHQPAILIDGQPVPEIPKSKFIQPQGEYMKLTQGDCVVLLGQQWAEKNGIKTAADMAKPATEEMQQLAKQAVEAKKPGRTR